MKKILIIIGISLLAKSSYAAGDFFKDYTPLPKGEYIFEIRRTDSGACDDRNNISATVKADSVRSTQPQEARVPLTQSQNAQTQKLFVYRGTTIGGMTQTTS